jgi:hypothetical protein
MRESEIIEAIQTSTVLPPTLAAELIQALPRLSAEKVGWIVSILQQAHTADIRYSMAVARIEELLRANQTSIEREVMTASEPVLNNILAEFEEELDLLTK